jgi:hypothetical protein
MTMFKIKNCDGITLTDNETSSEKFLDAEDSTNIKATGNKAGVDFTQEELVKKLESLIISLKKEDDTANLTSNMEDLADELREESPTQSRVKKWLGRVSLGIETAKVSAQLIEEMKGVVSSLETYLPSITQ